MPACQECGTSLREKAKFCSECGARQPPQDAIVDPLLGQQLGAYRVVSCISEGGMGRVYRAEQLSLGRMVCIKTLLPSLLKDRSMVQRFEQEARATSALRHPNIVSVLDFGSGDSQLYFVMELVEGEDLAQLLKRGGSLPWARATELLRQILSALGEAHAAGIIHRDLKPANVMVSKLRDGSDLAKVTDFGIAKLVDRKGTRITETGAMFGTPHYMAPEQIEGRPLDGRVDIYAAGVMLFELLTGQDVFAGSKPNEIFRHHLRTPPRSPSRIAPHPLPAQLDTIVLKALAKDREDRFQSALDFQRMLEMLQTGSLTQPPAGELEQHTAAMREAPLSHGARAVRSVLPGPLADHVGDLQSLLAGDKRNVTVMFADIENFTGMAASMDAEQLRTLVNRCFDGMVEAVARYDGTVDKFMGDCMMAVFGAPRAHEDDPERAVRAALDALSYLGSMNKTLRQPLAMRIGIHAGEVVAGGVGGGRRMDYTVMGEVVNLAQRLQTSARPGTVLVSEEVQRATEKLVHYRRLDPFQVKGKAAAIVGYEVIALLDEGVAGDGSKLVGRRSELAKLQQVLTHAARGRVAGALLVGAPGIGKTKLLDEAQPWAEKARLCCVRARAGRLGRRQHLDVIRQLLVALAGDPDLHGLSELGVAPRSVERLLHLVNGTSMPGRFEAEDNLLMNRAAVEEALRSGWEQRGLCVLVDDAQLADEASLELLEQLLLAGAQRRFALIVASRSGDTSEILPKLPRLTLAGLSAADVVKVARNELSLDALPEDVAQLVAERADGNPLIAIEVVRALIDRGDLVLSHGDWQRVGKLDSHAVPSRLAALVTARTDALSAAARSLLRMAAVAGRSFNLDQVARALGRQLNVTAALDECRARGFIVRSDVPGSYLFPQSMVHDALLDSVTDIDRRQLHLALAQALEATNQGGEPAFDALAHHYLNAGHSRRANRYLVSSANILARNHAYEEAASRLEQALGLVLNEVKATSQPGHKLAGSLYEIARKLICTRAQIDVERAIKVLDQVLPHAPPHLAAVGRAKLLGEHATALNKVGNAREAQRYLENAHTLLFNLNEPEAMATIYSELSTALEAQGNLGKATDVLVEGFRMVAGSTPDDPDLLWRYLNQLGRLHLRAGQHERAELFFANALEHAERAHNGAAQARIISNQGSLRAQGGDYASAERLLTHSLQMARDSGDQVSEARGHYNLGRLLLAQGNAARGTDQLRQAVELSRRLGYREGLASALSALDSVRPPRIKPAKNEAR